ncbi:nuclear transport factor 2 family protein [Paraglaciecola aestuariivivens]
MKASWYILFGVICFPLFSGCVTKQTPTAHPVIASYSAAWNSKDLKEMSALMHPDIEWASVVDGAVVIEVAGKDALVAELKTWFSVPSLPTGSLRDWSINGNYVAVTETAHWLDKTGKAQGQSALTVYELQDGLIRRVYYFPSQKVN